MSHIKKALHVLVLSILVLSSINCSSFGKKMKSWMGGEDDKKSGGPPVTSYSNHPNLMPGQERKYRRVTKDNFAEDQGLEEGNGSLWRKEGQASYLFSQNNLRLMGDIINVDVEGKAAANLNAKLSIIKTNLAQIEAPKKKNTKERQPATEGSPAPTETAASEEAKTAEKKFDTVPCRIIERNSDGSYRVKGQSSVYVGRHEYRLIVTGLVRSEDVSSDIVASSKLIDGKFDLVASYKEVR